MSLVALSARNPFAGFPRVSGDEPPAKSKPEEEDKFSPRERG